MFRRRSYGEKGWHQTGRETACDLGSIADCGTARCGRRIDSCASLQRSTVPPNFAWTPAMAPCPVAQDGSTQLCPAYTQRWVSFGDRVAAFAVPEKQVTPPGGWPFVVYFDFMTSYGHFSPELRGGLREQTLQFANNASYIYTQTVLHGLLEQGFAIVSLGEAPGVGDTLYYQPDPAETAKAGYDWNCNDDPRDDICWNGGNNSDATYIRAVLSAVKTGPSAQAGLPAVSFDASKGAIIGYSVGAQMVSRVIESRETLLPGGMTFKAAVMIAGGSCCTGIA